MTDARWKMNRAGLLNFWFYTDEAFQLSDGRLVLRGANGAGKSVTMQTFLPLVLDGDKRPVRLDPFGSKDRKMEYYLLGDDKSGVSDRTGYVYLEFLHPESGKTVTIGIGLRARRGAAQVGFWGFCLTDGRRVGRDFFLYDRVLFECEGEKVPLDRAGLEMAIGEGGKVVREQGEYRKLVNQTLFGFADDQAFKDFLTLLIQLRSPKLSKEFRPSTIYSILNDSLPPLGEEDLRPLSEVLQDMDEISDRLDELVIHQSAAKHLEEHYERYNRMWLFATARIATEAAHAEDEAFSAVTLQETTLQQAEVRRDETRAALLSAQLAYERTEQELASFEHSEAMDVQRDLESTEARVADTLADLAATKDRLSTNRRLAEQKQNRLEERRRQVVGAQQEQAQILEAMDRTADQSEFVGHGAYAHVVTERGRLLEESTLASWTADVDAYRELLAEGQQLCVKEQEVALRVQEATRHMGDARAARDAAETTLLATERDFELARDRQEDTWFAWYRALKELPLAEPAWREVLYALRQYGSIAYDKIIHPVRYALDEGERQATAQQLRLEHEKALKMADRAAYQEELSAWKTVRNAEPPRTEARAKTRQRRMEVSGHAHGAPLYMVCEFREEVDEQTRAAIETALHQSGLLDAWVAKDEPTWQAGDEDVWLKPSPLLFGYTLANYVKPMPPEDSGLTAEDVENVLRTIVIGDEANSGEAAITASGQYVLGPLAGQIVQKEAAEWIGYEARKRAKMAAMERLHASIRQLDDALQVLDDALETVSERKAQMREEYDLLPSIDDLQTVFERVEVARRDFSHAMEVEKSRTEAFRAVQQEWQSVKETTLAFTKHWQTLRRIEDFARALDEMRRYERLLQKLQTSIRLAADAESERAYLEQEVTDMLARIADDQSHELELQSRCQTLESKVASLYERLRDLGMVDVYAEQQQRKLALAEWRKRVNEGQEALRAVETECAVVGERLEVKRAELAEAGRQLERHLQRFGAELDLGLVDWQSIDLETVSAVVPSGEKSRQALQQTARIVYRALRGAWDSKQLPQVSTQLQEAFAVDKNTLLDYAFASEFDAALGRLRLVSGRDRAKPWTPRQVYQEICRQVEEQRVLISEKDRELYEQILIHSVGRAIRDKINRAEQWVKQMNRIMSERNTSSKLLLSLEWRPRPAQSERELDTDRLVYLLRKSPSTMLEEEMDDMMEHFRSRIRYAKEEAEQSETLSKWIHELLDYRKWFSFTLYYRTGAQSRSELTDSKFNVLSGGEKAMAMYIPLFAATDSRFNDSNRDAPRIISLDEAFAGVDEENVRDMFQLLTEMQFDYMMTTQQLWGCYDTVPALSIYEIYRPEGADYVTLFPYYWNGHTRQMVTDDEWGGLSEVSAAAR